MTPTDPTAQRSEALAPRFYNEPNRLYQEMRREHVAVASIVLEGGIPAWLVLGYRELHQVTADPRALHPRLRILEPVAPRPRGLAAGPADRPWAAVRPVHDR